MYLLNFIVYVLGAGALVSMSSIKAEEAPRDPLAAISPPTAALLKAHVAFLNSHSAVRVTDLMHSLLECAESDDRVAYHLWVLVFPIVWASLQKDVQVQMAKPIINLISKVANRMQPSVTASPADRLSSRVQVRTPASPTHPSIILRMIY